ncbi:MAG: citrate synthase [Chloroflexi bacterium]|nr:citrate synthase [Chloroflexota bacterium]
MTNPTEQYYPGLEGVIAGETAISTIAGGLQYRGYSIQDLAEKSTFEEVAYLLIHGNLPSESEFASFKSRLADSREVPESVYTLFRSLPTDANAMDVLRTGVSILAHHDADTGSIELAASVRKAERLLAAIPTLVTAWSRIKSGNDPVAPRSDLDFSANLLNMLHGSEPAEVERHALDVSLILYAEHEYNASSFTARVAASTLTDLHGAVVAAIAALKGPLHGGANEKAVEVLLEVGSKDNAEAWIRNAFKTKRLVMGFGHRVYKEEDPRATILKRFCMEIAPERDATEWEDMADIIEKVMWDEKHLPPNMDWPAGRLYRMIGLETEIYTPLFVASRITGWAAHVIEQQSANRLIRPRATYVGPAAQSYVPITERE